MSAPFISPFILLQDILHKKLTFFLKSTSRLPKAKYTDLSIWEKSHPIENFNEIVL